MFKIFSRLSPIKKAWDFFYDHTIPAFVVLFAFFAYIILMYVDHQQAALIHSLYKHNEVFLAKGGITENIALAQVRQTMFASLRMLIVLLGVFFVILTWIVQKLKKAVAQVQEYVQKILAINQQLHKEVNERENLINEFKKTSRKQWEAAFHDAVIHFPNRQHFEERVTTIIAEADRLKQKVAVFIIDLDEFNRVNDTLGNESGDEILKIMERRIESCLRHMDIVVRIGGDEFAVVLSQVKENAVISRVAEKIRHELEKPVTVQNTTLSITGSVGMAIYPEDAKDIVDLMKKADVAMYNAKEGGKNTSQFYSEGLQARLNTQATLMDDLRLAIEKKEIDLYYQPLISLEKHAEKVFCFEVLASWRHSALGLISPKELVELAEKAGLISTFGDFVLKTACEQFGKWHDMGFSGFSLSINVSTWQLRLKDIVMRINHVLTETRMPHNKLILELTESVFADEPEEVLKTLMQLREQKICLAVDDFGDGYSSMDYLRQIAVNLIKIDKKFAAKIVDNPVEESIVKAMLALAKGLDTKVLANGVETEQQKERLLSLGCMLMQGNLFGKPLSADEQTEKFKENGKEHS